MSATSFTRIVNGIPRVQTAVPNVVNNELDVVATVVSGTSVTIPGSGSYTGDELEITLNGIRLLVTTDYVYVGSPPRTQVQFAFDLVAGDILNFRTDRIP